MSYQKNLESIIELRDLEKLIAQGVDLNKTDNFGRSILFYAIVNGYNDIVSHLVKANCNINLPDNEGKTPLHFCAMHSNLEACSILIDSNVFMTLKIILEILLSLLQFSILKEFPKLFYYS